ncbi:unnamed protein product, partial [Sphacelaria rigidula]
STDGDGVVSDSAAAADGDEPAAPAVGIKPWERKKRVAAVKKKPSVDDGGEGAAMGGEVGGEEEAAAATKAAPAKPWKSKANSSRANQPAKPWQKRALSDGAGDGEGRDAGEITDLNNGVLEAAPAGVTKPSGNGEGCRGSVDELEAALEHREWKWRLAVFKDANQALCNGDKAAVGVVGPLLPRMLLDKNVQVVEAAVDTLTAYLAARVSMGA